MAENSIIVISMIDALLICTGIFLLISFPLHSEHRGVSYSCSIFVVSHDFLKPPFLTFHFPNIQIHLFQFHRLELLNICVCTSHRKICFYL